MKHLGLQNLTSILKKCLTFLPPGAETYWILSGMKEIISFWAKVGEVPSKISKTFESSVVGTPHFGPVPNFEMTEASKKAVQISEVCVA